MSTTAITSTVTQINRIHFVNAYLVQEDDGFTLVDTTVGGGAKQLIAAATDLGGKLRRIALTHGHGDHVGSLDALKQQLGDEVEVLMPELDARIHAGENVVDGKLPGSWPDIKTTPDTRLNAGDRVGSLEVVPSPGHTPGHVSFLDTRDRTLIVGDTFTTYGSVAVTSHYYWRFPFATMGTWDRAKDLESARSLRALEPQVLAVGHGPVVRDPVSAMDAAIEKAARATRS